MQSVVPSRTCWAPKAWRAQIANSPALQRPRLRAYQALAIDNLHPRQQYACSNASTQARTWQQQPSQPATRHNARAAQQSVTLRTGFTSTPPAAMANVVLGAGGVTGFECVKRLLEVTKDPVSDEARSTRGAPTVAPAAVRKRHPCTLSHDAYIKQPPAPRAPHCRRVRPRPPFPQKPQPRSRTPPPAIDAPPRCAPWCATPPSTRPSSPRTPAWRSSRATSPTRPAWRRR